MSDYAQLDKSFYLDNSRYGQTRKENAIRMINTIDLTKLEKEVIRVHIHTVEDDRTLQQNALQHKWYQEIAKQRGDMMPIEVKCECKLLIGIPLLCAHDSDFGEKWQAVAVNMEHESLLYLMKYFDVTSLFTKKQATEYMNEIQMQYSNYRLTQPE